MAVTSVLGFISKNELSAGAIRDFLADGSHGRGCRHEALIYSSADELAAGTLPFVQQGLTRGDRLLVVLREAGQTVLREALGGDAAQIEFADSIDWYRSPEHAFERYGRYLSDHLGRGASRVRVVAEVIWPQSSAKADIDGWKRYEVGSALRWLLCPCRSSVPTTPSELPDGIVRDARRTHPVLRTAEGARPSAHHSQPATFVRGLDREAPESVRAR